MSADIRSPYEAHYKNDELVSIVLPIDPALFGDLPEVVTWNGVEFSKKVEFHVTLIHVQQASELSGASREETALLFDSFVEKNPIAFLSLLNDIRQAEEGKNKTILARCIVSNIDELFAHLNTQLKIAMPVQPAHVTLYSVEYNRGIHVNSNEKMESLDRVQLPELEVALSKVKIVA